MDVSHRAPELDHANADAETHAPDECFLEEADEPKSGLRFALRALQFLPRPFDVPGDSGDGRWNRIGGLAACPFVKLSTLAQ
jgi:hypothetical protein